MSLTQCDFCGEPKGLLEPYCSRCGAGDSNTTTLRTLLLIGVIFIPIVVIGGLSEDEDSDYRDESQKNEQVEQKEPAESEKKTTSGSDFIDKSTAYYMCEQWVKKRIKSPSTADFPSASEGKFDNTFKDGDGYQVWSYVDSENSLGATVRTGFTCITEQVSEDDWVLKKLEMD